MGECLGKQDLPGLGCEMSSALFKRTFEHPELGALIQLVPTEWAFSIANPAPSLHTDLGDGTERRVGFATLTAHMLRNGMRDPLVIGVGTETGKVRLDAGNHRIRCFMAFKLPFVPAIASIGGSHIWEPGNGLHEGLPEEILQGCHEDGLVAGERVYQALSETLARFRAAPAIARLRAA